MRWNMSRHIGVLVATLLVVTAIAVFLPSGYISAGGMVVNQSFELGDVEVPAAWNLTENAMRVDSGPVYAGNWAAQITGSNDTLTQWIYLGNSTMLMPITYNAWGWVYVSGNVTGVIALDFWTDEGGTPLSAATMLSATDTNGEYVQRTTAIQSPPGATYVRIRLLGTGWHAGTEARFDEVGFYPVTGYCFVATAAYGTETAAELDVLRDFRDQVLLKTALGSRFVEAYYGVSPPIADFIAENDFLRSVVREVFVDPIVNLLQWSQGLWRV